VCRAHYGLSRRSRSGMASVKSPLDLRVGLHPATMAVSTGWDIVLSFRAFAESWSLKADDQKSANFNSEKGGRLFRGGSY